MITESFLAVADIADIRPFRKAMRLKKLDKAVSLRLPIALVEFLSAIFNRLLPLGILLLRTRPLLILVLGDNLNQLANALADSNL
jgi:hypothetical protein